MIRLGMTALLLGWLVSAALGQVRMGSAAATVAEADGAIMARDVIASLGEKPGAWVLFARESKTRPDVQQEILRGVRSAAADVPLVGCCTTTGLFAFSGGKAISGEVLLIGLAGEGVRFEAAAQPFKGPGQLVSAAEKLAQDLRPASGGGLLFLLSDAIISHDGSYPIQDMYRALQQTLGGQVGIVGGNAAYGDKPVYCNDAVASKSLVGLMISGSTQMAIVQEPDKEAISPVMKVTKLASPREIVELDGRPWAEVYHHYAGHRFDASVFDAATRAGSGDRFRRISEEFPLAILRERGQLYVKLAHGLSPWNKGNFLPSECYDLKVGDEVVITRHAEDQVGSVRQAIRRAKRPLAEAPLVMLFPCESNAMLMRTDVKRGSGQPPRDVRKEFFAGVLEELDGAPAFGFMPCGEHASLYEPGLDHEVGEARYYQLSYPVAAITNTAAEDGAAKAPAPADGR